MSVRGGLFPNLEILHFSHVDRTRENQSRGPQDGPERLAKNTKYFQNAESPCFINEGEGASCFSIHTYIPRPHETNIQPLIDLSPLFPKIDLATRV